MKYLIHVGICGFGNQLLGLKEACIIAKKTNRTLILPKFIPHGTIRKNCKKYYEFKDVFNVIELNKTLPCCEYKTIENEGINNVYFIRNEPVVNHYYDISKLYYNITDPTIIHLKKKFLKNNNDFNEIENITDKVLYLVGTFNTIKLSTCSKNGCLNKLCKFNPLFKKSYDSITTHLIFNNNINKLTDSILSNLNLKKNNYCAFHLRTLDISKNKKFKDCYNNYDEEVLYQTIINYLHKLDRPDLQNKIFLAAPPQFLNIMDINIFNTDKVIRINHNNYDDDAFILSLVEINILENSEILITSPTNTPNMKKEHTRSSFIMHATDARSKKDIYNNDICVNQIYQKG